MVRLKLHHAHRWDLAPKEAMALQERLRAWLRIGPGERLDPRNVKFVAGLDVAYLSETNCCYAAVALLSHPGFEMLECATVAVPSSYPYVPGLLSFREVPPLIEALRKLSRLPDLLVLDGQGFAHPRRFGLACHLGVLLDRPTLGIAKSLLVGEFREPSQRAGAATMLRDKGEQVGWAFRSRAGCKPVFVSAGHRLSLRESLAWARRLRGEYRQPDVTRLAHLLSRRLMHGEI
ncbi:MAG: deoxyribonuclease V [bacterium]